MLRLALSIALALGVLISSGLARAVLFEYEGTIEQIAGLGGVAVDPTDLFSVGSLWRIRIDPECCGRLEVELGDYFFAAEAAVLFDDAQPGGSDEFAIEMHGLFIPLPERINGQLPGELTFAMVDNSGTALTGDFSPPDPELFDHITFVMSFRGGPPLDSFVLGSHNARLVPEPKRSLLAVSILGIAILAWIRWRPRGTRLLLLLLATPIVGGGGAGAACPPNLTDPIGPCSASSGCYTVAIVGDTQELVDGAPELPASHNPDDPNHFVDPTKAFVPGDATTFDPNSFVDDAFEGAQYHTSFTKLVDWILANQATQSIAFVVQVGDIVQLGVNIPEEPECVAQCQNSQRCRAFSNLQQQFVPCNVIQPPDTQGINCRCDGLAYLVPTEWKRFRTQWGRLDDVVPYAIVRGNHDNEGILEAEGCPGDLAKFSGREIAAFGFTNYYAQSRMSALPGHVSTHVQCNEVPAPPNSNENRRRGTSHESPRLSRRLHSLRRWSGGKAKQVFARGEGAVGPDGPGARGGVRLALGGDPVDRGEAGLLDGDAAQVGGPERDQRGAPGRALER